MLDHNSSPLEHGEGELVLVPPSIGFSITLLNRDHHTVSHAALYVSFVLVCTLCVSMLMHSSLSSCRLQCKEDVDRMRVCSLRVCSSRFITRTCPRGPTASCTADTETKCKSSKVKPLPAVLPCAVPPVCCAPAHGTHVLCADGYYRACGRCDETMKVGGINVSSAELERVCDQVPAVLCCVLRWMTNI